MKTGLEMQDLAAELQRRAESAEDYVADTRTMGFHVATLPVADGGKRNVPLLVVDGHDSPEHVIEGDEGLVPTVELGWPVKDHAQNQIAQRLGIPFRFFERMRDDHPDILDDTVSKLFTREPERRMIRTLDGGARAFLSDRYRRLDNYDLAARAVFPALAEADQSYTVMSTGLTDLRLYVKLIWPEITAEVKPGDTVHPGIVVSNSEVGAGALAVEPFTFRDFCLNGSIWGLEWAEGWGMRKQHVGKRIEDSDVARGIFSEETLRKDDDAFFAMVKDLVSNASSAVQFEAMVQRLRDLAELKIGGDPVLAVERLAQATNLQEGEQAAVMAHLIEGGDLTAYGFWNAVTRTAADVESYDRATELERVGGRLVEWTPRQWGELAKAA